MHSLSRRLLLAGAASLPLGDAWAAGLALTPPQTEGPFYPTSLPADADSDLVQVRGQQAQAMGTVLHLRGRVLDLDGDPVRGALVEIWQSDNQGLYDHPSQSSRERRDRAFQGYGRTQAGEDGSYGFRTLKPVAYPGRTPHIHVIVGGRGYGLTTQFYVAGDPRNERDFVFRGAALDPARRARIEMTLVSANGLEPGAYVTSMDIVVQPRRIIAD